MKAASWAIKRGDRANPIGQQFVLHIRSGSSILDALKRSGWSSGLSLLPQTVEIVAPPLRHFQAFFPVCAAMIGRANLVARSEEHTSELQSLMRISYAVFCLKKKKIKSTKTKIKYNK